MTLRLDQVLVSIGDLAVSLAVRSVEDGGTMMLVPTELHSQVAHTGGMARYRDSTGGIGYGD